VGICHCASTARTQATPRSRYSQPGRALNESRKSPHNGPWLWLFAFVVLCGPVDTPDGPSTTLHPPFNFLVSLFVSLVLCGKGTAAGGARGGGRKIRLVRLTVIMISTRMCRMCTIACGWFSYRTPRRVDGWMLSKLKPYKMERREQNVLIFLQ
jgi:hypothetical protein